MDDNQEDSGYNTITIPNGTSINSNSIISGSVLGTCYSNTFYVPNSGTYHYNWSTVTCMPWSHQMMAATIREYATHSPEELAAAILDVFSTNPELFNKVQTLVDIKETKESFKSIIESNDE